MIRWVRQADPLTLIRVGLCLVMLLRHEDFLRGFIHFEHHEWGPGPEFGPQSLARASPSFAAPLVRGFDALLPWSGVLCRLRLALTVLLLVGLFPRLNAFLLALVSWSLFAADGFRYLHHLLILYVSILFLAFPQQEPAAADRTGILQLPCALRVLRAHVMVVYLAAGLAKLNAPWLSGRTIAALHEHGFIKGALFDAGVSATGVQGLAIGACATELLVPVLLFFRKTRLVGALLAVALHVAIHETMLVATFGGTMLVLLLSFLPCAAERDIRPNEGGAPAVERTRLALRPALIALAIASASPVGAWALCTTVGSYTMFTRLVRYELVVDVDGAPLAREALARHLGRDGARIVRLAHGQGIGETNVQVLRTALPELGAFVCRIRPQARRVRVHLTAQRIEGGFQEITTESADCPLPG